VTLTGTGVAAPAIPVLGVLDNFNRATTLNNLGSNWSQPNLFGFAAIRVLDTTTGNIGTGVANAPVTPGDAFWSPTAFGGKQAAAFLLNNATITGDSLLLDATQGTGTAAAPQNFIRVRLANGATGSVVVEYTTNAQGAFTTSGTASLATGTAFASGDTITAQVDGTIAPATVYVWRTTAANVTTFVGAVQIAPGTVPTGGNARIGIHEPVGAQVDNFAGGTTP
jgi:hypothetical protein